MQTRFQGGPFASQGVVKVVSSLVYTRALFSPLTLPFFN